LATRERKENKMKSHYFPDTDTLLIELSNNSIGETRDLNDNVLDEFDSSGKSVSITIEHIRELVS
jgi:uncharacterized protein YuzE